MLESTLAVRTFEVDQKTQGKLPMVYAPQGQSGNFFNRQERNVRSLQVVEALTISKDEWLGQHVFKVGLDLQHSRFDGDNYSQEVDVVRLDGSLAERTTYSPALDEPEVSGTEFAVFVQDRWRVNDRLNFELGMRVDLDDIVEGVNYSPRVGMSVSVLPEGRGILRGGFGKFAERTPLTVGAFTQYEVQTVSRFAADGAPLGAPVTFAHVLDGTLKTPESIVQTVAWDQRFGRRFFFKAAYLHRNGSHAYIVDPDPSRGVLTLGSVGESKYWEIETTGRFLASEYRDLTVSYVRSHGTRDLNDYDQFYGNFRNPIIRFNANSLNPTDVPNRLIVRGTIGLPGKLGLLAALRVADRISVVGGERVPGLCRRAQPGGTTADGLDARLHARPAVALPEVSTSRPGLKIYNVFDAGNERDVQTNITSPDYGKFYNPIQRSIGFVLGTTRP